MQIAFSLLYLGLRVYIYILDPICRGRHRQAHYSDVQSQVNLELLKVTHRFLICHGTLHSILIAC